MPFKSNNNTAHVWGSLKCSALQGLQGGENQIPLETLHKTADMRGRTEDPLSRPCSLALQVCVVELDYVKDMAQLRATGFDAVRGRRKRHDTNHTDTASCPVKV